MMETRSYPEIVSSFHAVAEKATTVVLLLLDTTVIPGSPLIVCFHYTQESNVTTM